MAEVLISITVVALGWPLLRLVMRPDFRQSLIRKPSRRVRVLFARALAAAGAAIVLVGLGPMEVKLVIAAVSVAVLAFVAARSRAGFGRGRGLPPGTLPVFNHMDRIDDQFFLNEAAAHGCVFKTVQVFRPVFCIADIGRGAALLRVHGDKLRRIAPPFSGLIPKGFIRYMGRNSHPRYRAILKRLVSPQEVSRSAPAVAAATQEELRRFAAACAAEPGSGISLNEQMPASVIRIFIILYFGVRHGSDDMQLMEHLYDVLNCRDYGPSDKHAASRALRDLADRARALANAAKTDAGGRRQDGAYPGYFPVYAGLNPAALDDRTLVGNIVCLVQLSAHDVSGLLRWIWKNLSDNPEWQERLRAELGKEPGAPDGGLMDRIISESLRLDQSEYIVRRCVEGFEFDGFTVPKDWGVRICVRESHRDPAKFENPEKFDPDRFLDRQYSVAEYAPLGLGATNCIGRGLIYAVARAWLFELLENYDWTATGIGPRWHDGHHWTPGKNFRVHLSPRAGAGNGPSTT